MGCVSVCVFASERKLFFFYLNSKLEVLSGGLIFFFTCLFFVHMEETLEPPVSSLPLRVLRSPRGGRDERKDKSLPSPG